MTTFALDEWLDFAVGGGVELGPVAGGRLQLCPQAFVASTAGAWTDEFGTRTDYSEKVITAGASTGYLIRRTRRTQISATATVLLVGGRGTRSFPSGVSRSTDIDSYGTAALGLGVQISRDLTFIPSIAIPFGARHGGSSYRVRFSLRLGKLGRLC